MDVGAHHHVRAVARQARRLASALPGALVGEHREHDRLRGADRRRAGRLLVGGGVEQAPDHRDHPLVDDLGLRILVLVDQVLGKRLRGESVGLGLHPARDERGEVERGVAVEIELVDLMLREIAN